MSTPAFSPLPPGEGQGEGLPLLIDNFAAIAAAPGRVKKLRELILELAVTGKLLPQDPSDEPACALLAKIQVRKAALIKAGTLKRGRALAPVAINEKIFFCPTGWEYVRFGDLGVFVGGKTPSTNRSEYWDGSIPWITPKDMKLLDLGDSEDHVTELALEDGMGIVPARSVLVVVRSGILRRTVPVAINTIACTVNQDIKALCLADPGMAEYVRLMVRGFERFVLKSLTKIGTTVESIKFEEFEAFPFLMPPLAEQHRIVTKVDELMALCDRLESGQADAERAHQQLVTELLATLTQSATPDDFAANWQRLSQHFDTLFTTEASIDALKQTILQLAVMGKLVPQDPNDESATKHLQEVGKKNIGETRSGKFSKGMIGTEIGGNESPYEIPDGWVLSRFGDAVEFLNGYAFKSEWFSPSGIRLLRNINVSHGVACWDALACVSKEKAAEYDRWSLAAGDVVLSLDRPLITSGLKCAVVREVDLPCLLLQRVAKLTPIRGVIDQRYLVVWLTSPLFTQTIDPGRSNGVPHISTNQVSAMPFLLPPLAEQHRIVTKVDELMSICNTLKSRLTEFRSAQEKLSAVLIEQAVA